MNYSIFYGCVVKYIIAQTRVTIEAAAGNRSVSAVLTINTASKLILSPAVLIGSNPSTATVKLTGIVTTPTAVNLSSNSAAAGVPLTATVAAGADSTTFQITTTAVLVKTTATITAAVGGN